MDFCLLVWCRNTLEFRPPPLYPFDVVGIPPLKIIKRDDDLIMSLTSFLNKKDVREKFREEYPKPRFDIKKEILCPPLTQDYGLVGTSFDYQNCLIHIFLNGIIVKLNKFTVILNKNCVFKYIN